MSRTPEQFAEDALALEQATSGMAKMPDTAEQFERYHGVMKHALIAAGKALAQPWPQQFRRVTLEIDQDMTFRPHKAWLGARWTPKVGFFMPTATLLAHSRNLLTYLDAIGEYGPGRDKSDPTGQNILEPVVYTFERPNDVSPEFSEAFSRHSVRHLGHDGSMLSHWQRLRETAIAEELDAMVFVSVVQGMAFATSMGVAPRHIWWAHKWHGLGMPGLDGYIDACHPFTDGHLEIGDRIWRSTYTALPEMLDATKTAEAKRIRESLPVATVYGWMGRIEKLTSEYLTAVAQVLEQVPDSIFVYTGREEDPGITQAIAAAGLADRISFIGWVDTALWAQVIDVYLDTFPFQSGHCAYQAMAAGKPVVWLHDDQVAAEQSASALIKATWEEGARSVFGGQPPWNTTTDDYISGAVFLSDRLMGIAVGEQMRHWLEKFMMDRRRMAQSVTRAILEIVDG